MKNSTDMINDFLANNEVTICKDAKNHNFDEIKTITKNFTVFNPTESKESETLRKIYYATKKRDKKTFIIGNIFGNIKGVVKKVSFEDREKTIDEELLKVGIKLKIKEKARMKISLFNFLDEFDKVTS